jgi:hypothetical protein
MGVLFENRWPKQLMVGLYFLPLGQPEIDPKSPLHHVHNLMVLRYTSHQLALTAHAFGIAKLQDGGRGPTRVQEVCPFSFSQWSLFQKEENTPPGITWLFCLSILSTSPLL